MLGERDCNYCCKSLETRQEINMTADAILGKERDALG
jgi:hypothetical protein